MVLDEAALARWLDGIDRADVTAFDIEGSSLDPMQTRIVGVSLVGRAGTRGLHPARSSLHRRAAAARPRAPRSRALRRGSPIRRKKKLGQNVKYDEHALANEGLALGGVAHDTLLESYVLESHKPHDMDNLAWRHLNVKTLTYDEVTGKGVNRIPFEQVAVERATEYAAEDADITLRLHEALYPRSRPTPSSPSSMRSIELPVRDVLFRMERNGILIDSALLAKHGKELGERVLALEQQAHQLAGGPFNLGSPKQICEILFQRMNLPVLKKTATGAPSTDEDVLQELAADYPLPKVLLEHRALVQAQVDVHRQAAADGQRQDRSRAHDVRAGHRGHRPPRVERSQPAEHPGAHGRRPPHPRGVHRAARPRARIRRLFADRAAHHGAPVGGSRAAPRLPRRPRHPSRDGRRDLRRRRPTRSRPTSAATSRPSTSGSSTA